MRDSCMHQNEQFVCGKTSSKKKNPLHSAFFFSRVNKRLPCGMSSEADDLQAATIVPTLNSALHDKFGGPHTQYASPCFYYHPSNGSLIPATIVVTCTQIYLCDSESYVLRVMLVERLLAVYQRHVSGATDPSIPQHLQPQAEQELLLIFDREHDLLVKGELVCAGVPAKPLLATIMAVFRAHSPNVPVALHPNCPAPLREVAKLRPPPGYVAPLPQKEDQFENCPCWRQADVLNITTEEFTNRVRNMFIVYAPDKLGQLHDFIKKYGRKKKGGALQHLVAKYGPEPSDDHAAAVLKVLEREKKFADIMTATLPGQQGKMPAIRSEGGSIPLSALMASQKRASKKNDFLGDTQPLFFSTVLLTSQPSGGFGRLHIRLRPIPYLELQQGAVTPFKRRPLDTVHEFWYLCNEGHVLSFDTSAESLAPFSYKHGDRVLSTWGVTRGRWSTVVGVRDGALWVHDDGDIGASSLVGFRTRDELERCNGWIMHENIANRLTDCSTMLVMTTDGTPRWMHITPEVLYRRFGFYHGEVVAMSTASCTIPFDGVAVIVGVSVEDETALYAFFVDPNNHQQEQLQVKTASQRRGSVINASSGSSSSLRITPSRYAAQPLIPRCMTPQDIQRQYAWKSVGIAKVLQYMPPSSSGSSTSDLGLPNPGVILS